MAKKKEVPKHIKEFYEKDKKIRVLLDTTDAVHSEAYHKGLEAIRDKETGEVDYDKLEEVRHQDAMLEKMLDHYLTEATRALKLKGKPKDELEKDLLLRRYIGVTSGELKNILRRSKANYTLKHHEKVRDQLMEKQGKELAPLKQSHLEEKHIDDILKHTGVKDYVAKDRIDIGHAVSLLDIYKRKGELHLSDLRTLTQLPVEEGGWGSDVHLTDKAKEGIKMLKEKYKKTS